MQKKHFYSQPLRVYVALGLLAILGIFCGMTLPVSLFPTSTKPHIRVGTGYGDSTAEEFAQEYGSNLEQQLQSLSTKDVKVTEVTAIYEAGSAYYDVTFSWDNPPAVADKEVQRVIDSWSARVPQKVRDSLWHYLDNEGSGFFAASFYSEKRGLDELYEMLEPVFKSKISQIPDADQPELWNPIAKEIKIELKPDSMVALQLLPADVELSLARALKSYDGGAITVGTNQLRIQLPRPIKSLNELGKIPVTSLTGRVVHLADIASIDFAAKSKATRIIKTSGSLSILLYAQPKAGGNIKQMSDDMMKVVTDGMKSLPDDVKYRILVDPSQFIRASINNVFHEVVIGSLLAVAILFVFIGSFKNVATAAIEIPLSLVLAFILMKLFGVNLNLISLGGLALSAGMNVDASVVVMENIFRHFEDMHGKILTKAEKLKVILEAVAEVRAPIITSTIASLVVFIPLLLTSDLSHAILGDLAKAVVFSHAFSAGVALILVPTVRMQLLGGDNVPIPVHESMFEKHLLKIDFFYERTLRKFMANLKLKYGVYIAAFLLLPILVLAVLPKLPREVIGVPDSDMMVVNFRTKGNTMIRQMEHLSDQTERRLLEKFGDKIQYTFTQVNGPNRATILPRLKNKSEMQKILTELEKEFVNTPQLQFAVNAWNPSEMPIPDPPAMEVSIRGKNIIDRRDTTLALVDLFESTGIFHRVTSDPNVERQKGLFLAPNLDQWSALQSKVSVRDVMNYIRTATEGSAVGEFAVNGNNTQIYMRYPASFLTLPEHLEALPLGIGGKVVPLKSVLSMEQREMLPPTYRKNGDEVFSIYGILQLSQKRNAAEAQKKAGIALADWQSKNKLPPGVTIANEDAGEDITKAIHQLGLAIGGSILLIFFVLLLEFGSIAEPLLILVAVPLGFIGVLTALFVFQSTLSLNSALGVILLNGIAVNNSIILVDFTKRLWEEGATPIDAALKAARLRLRPILITSLTTILGMMPIALGAGEGGKILQPLGIAVSGGLWISMLLTLMIVPSLQVSYLNHRERTK